MIDRETIDRIFATADIVDVVGDFVKLKRAGANYKGFSPFTNEKTASFFVSPGKGIFKCFSSSKGGNAVTFIMEHEKLSYPEALKYLAKKYNIEIKEKELDATQIKEKNDRESLLQVSNFAATQFEEWLWQRDEGKAIGLSYSKERGFREATIKKFNLGYSLEKRDAFTKLAIDKGYKLEYLTRSGLSIDKNNYQFDRFAGRVVFPIHTLSGQVIGFGGRILKKDDKMAKYLNSPESDIYHKSHVLYGMYHAKNAINKEDKCYLVEGYTDVISMHQAGIENVVSSSGTALTKEQIRLIKRFTKNVTVLYDGDPAGIKASLRGIDLILEEGLDVKVMLLPEGEDPDSYAKAHSSNEIIDFIQQNESDFISFKTKLLVNDAKDDPVQRAGLITNVVRSISVIPEGIKRAVYVKQCSKLLDIGEKLLYDEIQKIRGAKLEEQGKRERYNRPAYDEPKESPKVKERLPDNFIHEKELIQVMLLYGNKKMRDTEGNESTIANYVVHEMEKGLDFENEIYAYIYGEIQEMVQDKQPIDEKKFLYSEDPKISSEAVNLLTSQHKLSLIWTKDNPYFETEEMKAPEKTPRIVNSFKDQKVKNLLKKNAQELSSISANLADVEAISLCMIKQGILKDLEMELAKQLGKRTVF